MGHLEPATLTCIERFISDQPVTVVGVGQQKTPNTPEKQHHDDRVTRIYIWRETRSSSHSQAHSCRKLPAAIKTSRVSAVSTRERRTPCQRTPTGQHYATHPHISNPHMYRTRWSKSPTVHTKERKREINKDRD